LEDFPLLERRHIFNAFFKRQWRQYIGCLVQVAYRLHNASLPHFFSIVPNTLAVSPLPQASLS
jgi:hypothetical protein